MDRSRKRIFYLDYLRILATFAVVILHVAAQNWYITPIHTAEWKIYNWYNSSVRWAVPVFVMISGALFLNQNKPVKTKDIFAKSILRMVTAYLFWAFVYAAGGILSGQSLKVTVNAILSGYYHFWYMPMTMALYALVPVLRSFTASEPDRQKTEKYFLAVGFVLGFLFPRIVDFLHVLPLTHELFFLPKLDEWMTRMDFHFGAGYVYYFVLGHYISTVEIKRGTRRLLYLSGLMCIAATAIFTQWHSGQVGSPSEAYYSSFTLFTHCIAVSAFVFGKCTLSKMEIGVRPQKIVAFVSQCCFGIYLVHLWVLSNISELLSWHAGTSHPVYNVLTLSLAVFGISFIVSAVLNKIPVLKRYIV